MSDSTNAWSQFDSAAIPTKNNPSDFFEFLDRAVSTSAPRTAIDVGCGIGTITRALAERGLHAVGVDINAAAINAARQAAPHARFYVRDITSSNGLELDQLFELVVCQLVISVVGTKDERAQMLRNSREVLAPGGWLFLSASGRSDDINPSYAELYARDRSAFGEDGTYFSRDASGNVLYVTHHFTEGELRTLLDSCGFEILQIIRRREHSSRRPAETAWFLYATCRASA